MRKRSLMWMLIAMSLVTNLSACILVPVGGGDYHHGGGYYHEGHEHY
jgi:hypothetical protein